MNANTLQPGHTQPTTGRVLDIELLYLDDTTCTRCTGSDDNLAAALAVVQPALDALGVMTSLRRTHVTTAEQARQRGLVSSPTIRVNGRDIAPRVQESACGACSDLAGQPTDCRTWNYQGQDFTEAPVGLIVEAILAEIAADRPEPAQSPPAAALPANLERFFAAAAGTPFAAPTTGEPPATPAANACCSATEQATCCAPTEKAACCGAPGSGQCGCRAHG